MAFVLRLSADDTIQTGDEADFILAGGGNDIVDAGGGNDFINGGKGNDVLKGGAGADVVLAGKGNDTAVFVAADNHDNGPYGDFYDGGHGSDVLRLDLTADEWAQADIYQDIIDYVAFLESETDSGRDIWSSRFTFSSLNLTVTRFEDVVLYVDGVETDPLAGIGTTVIDLSMSTQDEVVQPAGDNDTIITTGTGNDTIITGNGKNQINAGNGNNEVTTGSGDDTIVTGTGRDVINSGAGDDVIWSGAGDDTIHIGDGNDIVRAGAGNDMIIAGAGNGDDIIDGGSGTDTVTYPSAVNPISVDLRQIDRSGTATLHSGTIGALLVANGYAASTPVGIATGGDIDVDVLVSIENVTGGAGDDTIIGDDAVNRLLGEAGADVINGGGGDDRIEGGADADMLFGEAGDDFIIGGAGDDTIGGGAGSDTLIFQGERADYDIVSLGAGLYQITDNGGYGEGTDVFSSIEQLVFSDFTLFDYELPNAGDITGTPGDDVLNGTEGSDSFYAMGGNDTIFGFGGGDYIVAGPGDDQVFGGEGYDAIDYSNPGTQGVVANLLAGTVEDQYGDTDTVTEVEMFLATDLDDTLIASVNGTRFYAFGGSDTITGNVGFDTISYEAGASSTRGIEVVFSNTVVGDGVVEVDTTGARDVFTSIEHVTDSEFDDILLGGIGNQGFSDGEGADLVDGGSGFDVLDVTGTGAVYIDMEDFLLEAEVASFVGGLGALDPETSTRLSADLTGFYNYTDGYGNNNIGRNIEQVVLFGGADDTVLGDSNDNRFEGFAGDDLLDGRGGNDDLLGGLGNDTLTGGLGADNLFGEDGNDILIGGAGSDFMEGGFGADEFRFAAGDGNDTIADFNMVDDILVLQGGLTIDSLSESDVGGEVGPDTIVNLSSGGSIVLLDVSGVIDPNELLF